MRGARYESNRMNGDKICQQIVYFRSSTNMKVKIVWININNLSQVALYAEF